MRDRMHETIVHNLMLLLRLGAFNRPEEEVLMPMSAHKWRVLMEVATALGVQQFVADGAARLSENTTLPPTLAAYVQRQNAASPQATFDISTAHLFNRWTQKRLEEVKEEEMNSLDTSDETLMLLDLIVRNAEEMITKDTNVAGIVAMGRFIESNKGKINFGKLEAWLAYIGLVQTASLEGNMLTSCLGFTTDEVPFAAKPFKRAGKLFLNSIHKVFTKHSFPTSTRMNVAMLETISFRLTSAVSRITDIEE